MGSFVGWIIYFNNKDVGSRIYRYRGRSTSVPKSIGVIGYKAQQIHIDFINYRLVLGVYIRSNPNVASNVYNISQSQYQTKYEVQSRDTTLQDVITLYDVIRPNLDAS